MKLDKTRAKKRTRLCQMPTPGNIAGRSSSITNAFFNAIIPIDDPSEEEELEALQILGMDRNDIRCAYCGEKSTEWDHLRAIITDQRPTGFITEIANLVPACGKCNQSKGKTEWKKWMVGPAKLSPTTRGVLGIEDRIARLSSQELWNEHLANWNAVRDLLTKSQKLATEIRQAIERYRLTLETRKASL